MHVKGARGTEVTGTVVEGAIGRIVATVWSKEGKYSVEFYRAGKTLLMACETFTFFEESAPPGAWRNFMGLAAWERHVYFDSQQNIGYAEARGLKAPAPGIGGEQLQERAQRLAQLLQRGERLRVPDGGGTAQLIDESSASQWTVAGVFARFQIQLDRQKCSPYADWFRKRSRIESDSAFRLNRQLILSPPEFWKCALAPEVNS